MKFSLIVTFLLANFFQVFANSINYLNLKTLPDFPPNSGYTTQPGLNVPYTGMDDGVLIVAGGANFPGKLPWEGGTKVFYDEIFILRTNSTGNYSFEKVDVKIPFAEGYCGTVETPAGLLCFCGNNSGEVVSESWFIDYSPGTISIEIKPGPELPVPLTNIAFAKVDVYIVTAQKNRNDWFIAGISDWTPMDLNITFDFLDDGNYEATICKDGINADRYAADYIIQKEMVKNNDMINIHLAPGGRFLIRFDKLSIGHLE